MDVRKARNSGLVLTTNTRAGVGGSRTTLCEEVLSVSWDFRKYRLTDLGPRVRLMTRPTIMGVHRITRCIVWILTWLRVQTAGVAGLPTLPRVSPLDPRVLGMIFGTGDGQSRQTESVRAVASATPATTTGLSPCRRDSPSSRRVTATTERWLC